MISFIILLILFEGYYLHGGLYPVARNGIKEKKVVPKLAPQQQATGKRNLSAWGIIGICLSVLALSSGTYYALYLCDLYQRSSSTNSNYQSNISRVPLTEEKLPSQENGLNGNITMADLNNKNSEVFP